MVDKLIGEFAVPSPAGIVALFGYLRADTKDSCYGVVTVRSSDTEDALLESIYWPQGNILRVRRLDTSNKVHLSFSGGVKLEYVAYDALLIPVQPYKKRFQPVVSSAQLHIDPTPVPAPNQTFMGSAKKRCRSRVGPVLLMSVRPGALSVLGPTSPGTRADAGRTGMKERWLLTTRRETRPERGGSGFRSVDPSVTRERRLVVTRQRTRVDLVKQLGAQLGPGARRL
ncbi:hypothetical protein HPB51_002988 [Rhipicephalus microplus]|uniref:Uncharacterized protein n=1 Tax=Rhipicephalus microplus TaxID=6941 RepID=A0A9J6DKY0_RHIMP|nr:hypothetical protein HPB51_002988 [Rhipicephalus microplus]